MYSQICGAQKGGIIMGNEEIISLKIPKSALNFADFYAGVCGEDRDVLLTKVMVERLAELRDKLKAMPHTTNLNIWEPW